MQIKTLAALTVTIIASIVSASQVGGSRNELEELTKLAKSLGLSLSQQEAFIQEQLEQIHKDARRREEIRQKELLDAQLEEALKISAEEDRARQAKKEKSDDFEEPGEAQEKVYVAIIDSRGQAKRSKAQREEELGARQAKQDMEAFDFILFQETQTLASPSTSSTSSSSSPSAPSSSPTSVSSSFSSSSSSSAPASMSSSLSSSSSTSLSSTFSSSMPAKQWTEEELLKTYPHIFATNRIISPEFRVLVSIEDRSLPFDEFVTKHGHQYNNFLEVEYNAKRQRKLCKSSSKSSVAFLETLSEEDRSLSWAEVTRKYPEEYLQYLQELQYARLAAQQECMEQPVYA